MLTITWEAPVIVVSSNGDGYYFVKLVDKTETQVDYVSLFIKFSEFDKRLEEIRAEGGVKEYIEIPEVGQTSEEEVSEEE